MQVEEKSSRLQQLQESSDEYTLRLLSQIEELDKKNAMLQEVFF